MKSHTEYLVFETRKRKEMWLEQLAPERPDYKHHETGGDNGDAHLKAMLLHHETT